MLVKIIKGSIFFETDSETIKCINEYEGQKVNHIIVCPDRYSLIVEKMVFESLNMDSTFNIEVIPVSKIFNRFCETDKKLLTSTSCLLIIQKILLSLNSKLKVFNKLSNLAFLSEEVYKLLSQIISCDITPAQLNSFTTKDNLLNDKLIDLSLIYSSYNEYISGNILDGNKQLDLLYETIDNLDLSNYCFYFVGYDSFTKQIVRILTKIIKYAKAVYFSCVMPGDNNNNKRIYTGEVYDDIMGICSNLHLSVKEKFISSNAKNPQQFMSKNLYGFSSEAIENNQYLSIFKHNNLYSEVKDAICKINIMKENYGYEFNDIQISVSNMETYKPLLEKEFQKFKIPYFFDQDVKVNHLLLIKFLSLVLKNLKSNFYVDDFFDLLNSQFIGIDLFSIHEYKNNCKKYSVEFGFDKNLTSDEKLLSLFEKLNILKTIYKNVKDGNSFIQLIENIITLFDLENKMNNIIQNSNHLDFIKLNEQTFTKLDLIKDAFNICFSNVETSQSELITLFDNICKTINISLVPIKTNAVYVGEVCSSYFENKKILIILGALEGDYPSFKKDNAIITDSEIHLMENNIKLAPTISTINKRNLFKAFNSILCASEKLFVSFVDTNSDNKKQQASFVDDLTEMFYLSDNIGKVPIITTKLNQFKENDEIPYKYSLNEIINEYAKSKISKNNGIYNDIVHYYFGEDLSLTDQTNSFENVSFDYFIKEKNVSISMIEKYNNCPYMFFVDYGIRPKEVESDRLKVYETGTIIHEIAEKFLKNYSNRTDIEKKVTSLFNDIIDKKYAYLKNNVLYHGILKNILSSTIAFCKNLVDQISRSAFKPKYFEFKFDDKNGYQFNFTLNDESYNINGKIDRVDVYNDKFIIIDYKTGRESASFDKIYYGLSLQLIFYSYVIKKLFHFTASGAFYLKQDNKTLNIHMDGFVLNDYDVSTLLDNHLFTNDVSDMFPIKIKEKDGVKEITSTLLLNAEDFDLLGKYIVKLTQTTIKNIKNNLFKPFPNKIKDSCKYCKYKNFCNFNEELDNYRNKNSCFNEIEFFKLLKDENGTN